MIEDAKNGVINCIIVKDLLHFGRNFIELGRYIDSLDRKIAVNLIEKIVISEDKPIEIMFKYQYNYNRVLSFIDTINVTQQLPNSEQIREAIYYG